MQRRNPRIIKISQKELQTKYGLRVPVSAITDGHKIYITNKTNKLELEHELAHCKLGHKIQKLTAYQYASREIAAQKLACNNLGVPFKKQFLRNLDNVLTKELRYKQRLSKTEKRELGKHVKNAINKVAHKSRIKYRI